MPETREEFWKADFTAAELREFAKRGIAMPDGSYPIPDAEYLGKAIKAVGRGANNSHQAIRQHIITRAKALGLASDIPDTWGADGTLHKAEDIGLVVDLFKADGPEQIVYGVVLTPDLPDSQGDIAPADEIRKAAHRWLMEIRKSDVQHAEVTLGTGGQPIAEPVESFIAPQDMELAGEKVLKGAWVIGMRVNDPDTWSRVEKRELTGFSIGGSAVRTPVAA